MDTHRTITSLEKIFSIAEKLLTNFDVEGLLTQVVKEVQELLDSEGATLFLVDPIEKLMISQVILSDRVERIVLNVDTGSIAGYTALHRISLNIPDAYADLSKISPGLKFNKQVDETFHHKTRNILTFPLIINGDLIGVFQVINKRGGSFSQEDQRILKNFSTISGIAIMNARLMERILEEQSNAFDIVEHITEKVIIHDLEGRIEHINRRAAEGLTGGLNEQSVKGRKFIDVFPQWAGIKNEIDKMIEHNLDKTFSGGKTPYIILTAKNARLMVEKIIVIINDCHNSLPDPTSLPTDRMP